LGTFIDFKDIHIPTNFIFIDWLNEDKKKLCEKTRKHNHKYLHEND